MTDTPRRSAEAIQVSRPPSTLGRLVSGGLTGADRAALDWAIVNGIPHGGWCPRGRKAEDGPIDERYLLQETRSTDYLQRTEWNVRDSDATVIFTIADKLTGGSRRTAEFASVHGKPVLHLAAGCHCPDASEVLREFVVKNRVRVLKCGPVDGIKGANRGRICDGNFGTGVRTVPWLTNGVRPPIYRDNAERAALPP